MPEDQQLLLEEVIRLREQVVHVSGQLDLLHQTAHVTNQYVVFTAVSVAAVAMVGMFLLGWKVARGR